MPAISDDSAREADRMLAALVPRLRGTCAVDLAFAGPRNPGGAESITIRHLAGHLGHSLRHLRVHAGQGLGGKSLVLGRPVVAHDYFNARHIEHSYDHAVAPERVHAALAVPVRLHDTVIGVCYLAHRRDVTFGDRIVADATALVQRLERDLAIECEVRRVLRARAETQARDARLLGELRRELEATIALVSEPGARSRLLNISAGLREIGGGAESGEPPARAETLSARELDVLRLVAKGASNNEAAATLGLTPNTVKAYLRSVTRKLGAANRTHAVALARNNRLIE
ncbi:LuxR C-terminal-related transcriptional regulator [Saccharomonospora sp. NPDC006951]